MARPNKLRSVQVLPSARDAYSLDVQWLPNRQETLPVIRYELRTIDPALTVSEWIDAGVGTSYNLTGLVPNIVYGVQVRAVNSDDNGFPSEYYYAKPSFVTVYNIGTDNVNLELSDDANIYLFTTLGGVDVLIRMYYNSSHDFWYMDIEWPVNTAAISGVVVTPFVDLIPAGVIPGQFNCYPTALSDQIVDPLRNAWIDSTHALWWTPNG